MSIFFSEPAGIRGEHPALFYHAAHHNHLFPDSTVYGNILQGGLSTDGTSFFINVLNLPLSESEYLQLTDLAAEDLLYQLGQSDLNVGIDQDNLIFQIVPDLTQPTLPDPTEDVVYDITQTEWTVVESYDSVSELYQLQYFYRGQLYFENSYDDNPLVPVQSDLLFGEYQGSGFTQYQLGSVSHIVNNQTTIKFDAQVVYFVNFDVIFYGYADVMAFQADPAYQQIIDTFKATLAQALGVQTTDIQLNLTTGSVIFNVSIASATKVNASQMSANLQNTDFIRNMFLSVVASVIDEGGHSAQTIQNLQSFFFHASLDTNNSFLIPVEEGSDPDTTDYSGRIDTPTITQEIINPPVNPSEPVIATGLTIDGYSPLFIDENSANEQSPEGTSIVVNVNGNNYYQPTGVETTQPFTDLNNDGVNDPDQEPLTVNGFSPLYTDQNRANEASPDGTSHEHIVNGITYYMPDNVDGAHMVDIDGDGIEDTLDQDDDNDGVQDLLDPDHEDYIWEGTGVTQDIPFYKFNEIPAENLTYTGEEYGFSLRFGYREMINGYYVWNPELILANGQANFGYYIYNWRETPQAIVQSIPPGNGFNGNVYFYGLDHPDYITPKLFYKFIHNDFSSETDWYELPVQETTGYVFLESGWDPEVNHVLFKDEDGHQFAVFNQSVPPVYTPPAAISEPTVQFYEGGYSTSLDIFPSTVTSTHVSFNVDGNYVDIPKGSVLYTFVDYAINLRIHTDYPSYLAVNKRNGETIGSASSNWRDNNEYNITPTKWDVGDQIELIDQSNDEVVFTFVLTNDMSVSYLGGGYPTPPVQAPQAFHYTNSNNQVEINPSISGNQITFYSAPTFTTDIDQHYYLYVPDNINQIKINYPVWVRNVNKNVWFKTAAYISQGYGGVNDRNSKWNVGDTLSIGSNSGSVQFYLTITNDSALAPP